MARALLFSLVFLAILLPALAACPQNCHCHGDLQHVICDKVGLQKIPKVSETTKLLNLQRNNFPVLAANSFRTMPNLVSLHLQHCNIREVAAGAFRGLKQLIYLYLSHNDIRVLRAGAFDDLTELTYLYLDHNKVSELPRGLLSPLVNLFILQLNNNKIRELRAGAFQGAKDLRWLYLSENALSSLQPGSLDDVENLAKFHLDKNQLSSYPSAALSKLRVVEELKLSHNPLKSIPDNAFQSFGRYLETLWLDNANLEKVSAPAAVLPALSRMPPQDHIGTAFPPPGLLVTQIILQSKGPLPLLSALTHTPPHPSHPYLVPRLLSRALLGLLVRDGTVLVPQMASGEASAPDPTVNSRHLFLLDFPPLSYQSPASLPFHKGRFVY